jgi:hypothetical protein
LAQLGSGRPLSSRLCYSTLDMVRFAKQSTRLVLLALIGSLPLGCGSDDNEAPPHGPKDLGISVGSLASSTPITEGSLSVDDCGEPLLAWISPAIQSSMLGDFKLEPPGACDVTNCGWLVVTASMPDNEPLVVQTISSPVRLDLPSTMRNGELTLRVELRDSWSAPVMGDSGLPLSAETTVTLTSQGCDQS